LGERDGRKPKRPPAGKVRWVLLAVLFGVTVINYADQAILSLAAPLMTK
jgi:ACS family glucarate transporter-like MFS transporter